MPEFEMPAGVKPPARPRHPGATSAHEEHHDAGRRASTGDRALTAEPDASGTRRSARGGTLTWRHVLIGAVLGAVVGAAIPGGLQLAERAAASADSDSLRTVATDYLAAIAEGRAADATAMVPMPRSAREVPDAVLQSADRITEAEVRTLTIDGDVATVVVTYEAGTLEVSRTLNAERMDGAWHLTDSLAEGVGVQMFSASNTATIEGFPLPFTEATHLYPGRYSFDEPTVGTLRAVAEPFIVDGDPGTPTETYYDLQLAPDIAAHAGDIAEAVAAQCLAGPECSLPADVPMEHAGGVWVRSVGESELEVSVQLMSGSELQQQWFEARMSIILDDEGQPVEWLCAPIDDFGSPVEPCPEVE